MSKDETMKKGNKFDRLMSKKMKTSNQQLKRDL